jgi:hypothetical protein
MSFSFPRPLLRAARAALAASGVASLFFCASAHAAEAPGFKAPAHWAGGWQALNGFTSGEMKVKPYLPAGASEANWSEAINLTTFTPRPGGSQRDATAGIITFMMNRAEAGCSALAQATEDPVESEGYVTQYAQFYCPRRPAERVSRLEFLKVVASRDTLYVFSFLRQGPFFTLQPPKPVEYTEPKETEAHNVWVKRADEYLRGQVKVCDKGFLGGGPCSK